MRIGLFGGSFDPPHDGHVHLAAIALRRLRLDRVWWLVSPGNPLKAGASADFAARLAAARDLARHPRFVVTDLEGRLATRYTVDTVAQVRLAFPAVRFVWLMGADNLAQLPRWKGWTRLMHSVPVAVIDRPGAAPGAALSKAAQRFAAARVDEADAGRLADLTPPAWTYLRERLHPESSTRLRGG
jgi:nicotinate-nucleotide adenylyltransferase